jgi:hypothetical protein
MSLLKTIDLSFFLLPTLKKSVFSIMSPEFCKPAVTDLSRGYGSPGTKKPVIDFLCSLIGPLRAGGKFSIGYLGATP